MTNIIFPLRTDVGDRLINGAWLLAKKQMADSDIRRIMGDVIPTYHTHVLTFHSGAGREQPFAVGLCDTHGRPNPITYTYYSSLQVAYFEWMNRVVGD